MNVQVAQRQVGVDIVRCIDGEREALDPPRGIKEMMESTTYSFDDFGGCIQSGGEVLPRKLQTDTLIQFHAMEYDTGRTQCVWF